MNRFKNTKNYYSLIMMILFIIYNVLLINIKINGLLYVLFMIVLILVNIIIMILFRKNISFKSIIIIIYFFTWLIFSKNLMQCLFALSSMITLLIIGYKESNFIKSMAFIILTIFILFFLPIYFIFLLEFDSGKDKYIGDIYEDMHYYCDNNYEVYSFSQGAMDGFHYSIGKHYEFLNIDGIISISYSDRNEVYQKDYNDYLNNHKCKLVGDSNGSK